VETLPEQAEWTPFPMPPADQKVDFVDGLHTLAGSGDPNLREGIALYVYMINSSMSTPSTEGGRKRAFVNTDGDFLLCVQTGNLIVQTEFGMLFLQPGEICVLQRGIRYSIDLAEGTSEARGYITEVWGSSCKFLLFFCTPSLGLYFSFFSLLVISVLTF
jgi:homogentisate 1,2-dioxygenase